MFGFTEEQWGFWLGFEDVKCFPKTNIFCLLDKFSEPYIQGLQKTGKFLLQNLFKLVGDLCFFLLNASHFCNDVFLQQKLT